MSSSTSLSNGSSATPILLKHKKSASFSPSSSTVPPGPSYRTHKRPPSMQLDLPGKWMSSGTSTPSTSSVVEEEKAVEELLNEKDGSKEQEEEFRLVPVELVMLIGLGGALLSILSTLTPSCPALPLRQRTNSIPTASPIQNSSPPLLDSSSSSISSATTSSSYAASTDMTNSLSHCCRLLSLPPLSFDPETQQIRPPRHHAKLDRVIRKKGSAPELKRRGPSDKGRKQGALGVGDDTNLSTALLQPQRRHVSFDLIASATRDDVFNSPEMSGVKRNGAVLRGECSDTSNAMVGLGLRCVDGNSGGGILLNKKKSKSATSTTPSTLLPTIEQTPPSSMSDPSTESPRTPTVANHSFNNPFSGSPSAFATALPSPSTTTTKTKRSSPMKLFFTSPSVQQSSSMEAAALSPSVEAVIASPIVDNYFSAPPSPGTTSSNKFLPRFMERRGSSRQAVSHEPPTVEPLQAVAPPRRTDPYALMAASTTSSMSTSSSQPHLTTMKPCESIHDNVAKKRRSASQLRSNPNSAVSSTSSLCEVASATIHPTTRGRLGSNKAKFNIETATTLSPVVPKTKNNKHDAENINSPFDSNTTPVLPPITKMSKGVYFPSSSPSSSSSAVPAFPRNLSVHLNEITSPSMTSAPGFGNFFKRASKKIKKSEIEEEVEKKSGRGKEDVPAAVTSGWSLRRKRALSTDGASPVLASDGFGLVSGEGKGGKKVDIGRKRGLSLSVR